MLPDFEKLVNEIRKLKLKNLFNCLVVVVPAMLIVVAITLFGGWFYKSYGNEKMAAELARQVEKREYEEWKANLELELEAERTKLEKDLAAQKREIESNAISEYLEGYSFSKLKKSIEESAVKEYKNSNDFVIDGATYVANNFFEYRILEIFYQEMPIKDKKNLGLYDWLNIEHKKYKEKFGNKTPREF